MLTSQNVVHGVMEFAPEYEFMNHIRNWRSKGLRSLRNSMSTENVLMHSSQKTAANFRTKKKKQKKILTRCSRICNLDLQFGDYLAFCCEPYVIISALHINYATFLMSIHFFIQSSIV